MRAWLVGLLGLAAGALGGQAHAELREVGPGKPFATPCAALTTAGDGDVVAIDAAGDYAGDVCAFHADGLTIRGVGGRARIDAAGRDAGGKAIWVIQGRDTTIEDVELSGCAVPDKNGAGIRQEGPNLTLRRVYLHDNENGILTGADPDSVILIEDSELARNGAGDGYSHNMYIGEVGRFTLRGSWSHDARVGHLVKSRALENHIEYSRLTDEGGSASYEIDLPQGGRSFVIGNVIQQSAATENPAFISFARESTRNPDSALWVVGNTFFDARHAGTFVAAAAELGPVITLRNNIFAGPGTIAEPAAAVAEGDFVGDPGFVDAPGYDYHLVDDSPARDQGVDPGHAGAMSLAPECQYVHPAHAVVRVAVGAPDPGAFEVGGESATPCGGALPSEPEADPVAEAAVEPSVEPDVEPAVEPAAEPAAEPVDEARAEADRVGAERGGCVGATPGGAWLGLALAGLWRLARRATRSRLAR